MLMATARSIAAIEGSAGVVIERASESVIETDGTFIAVPGSEHPPATYRFQAHAVPQAIGWARTFASALAGGLGADAESVADLKLAVSELVSETVVDASGELFTIEGRLENGLLVLQLTPWSRSDSEDRQLTAWDIASSLFDLEHAEASVILRVQLPVS